ncbi:MAG: hypothetical protein GY851_33125 [bacterium]|nr:hypothetical protein [bacterium]
MSRTPRFDADITNSEDLVKRHDCPCCLTRRRFIGSAAVVAAASAMTDGTAFAEAVDGGAATHEATTGTISMNSTLLPYDHVPPGFEMVIGNRDVEMGRVWNLWFNVTLSDDPRHWDGNIRAINAMQKRLDDLADGHRLIRAHMAEFCRDHSSFPNSLDRLCEEIGTSTVSDPPALGCEGRGLLESLGYHQEANVDRDVRAGLQAISVALQRWRDQQKPSTATDRQVSFLLGEYATTKDAFAERLIAVLGTDDDSIAPLRDLSWEQCQATGEQVLSEWRPFKCFDCPGSDEAHPICKCSYTMLARAGMLCANDSRPDGPPERLQQIFVQERVLVYASAVNAWLSDDRRRKRPPFPPMASVSKREAADIYRSVLRSLGEKEPAKVWLATCLLKTIVGSRRSRGSRELIDDFPELTRSSLPV